MNPFFVSVICLGDSSSSAKILISNPEGIFNLSTKSEVEELILETVE